MSDRGLELFTGRPRQQPGQLSVTLQRGGRFIVNQAIADLMGNPPTVELLFDRAAQRMAIRPATPDSAFAYPLRHHQRASTRLISGRKFMSHYGINRDTTRRYTAIWDGTMLLVDLKPPLEGNEIKTNEQHSSGGAPSAPSISQQEPVDAQHSRVG